MGKGINQIATWSDLASIGYRLHDNNLYDSKECITYADLKAIEDNNATRNCTVTVSDYTKCVKWMNVPGSDGTTAPQSENQNKCSTNAKIPDSQIRVPILVTLNPQTSGTTPCRYVTFRYSYKISSSGSWQSVQTGKCELISSCEQGTLSGKQSITCHVLINPKIHSTPVETRLEIYCGETRWNQNWTFSYVDRWGNLTSASKNSVKSWTQHFSGYTSAVRDIMAIEFSWS